MSKAKHLYARAGQLAAAGQVGDARRVYQAALRLEPWNREARAALLALEVRDSWGPAPRERNVAVPKRTAPAARSAPGRSASLAALVLLGVALACALVWVLYQAGQVLVLRNQQQALQNEYAVIEAANQQLFDEYAALRSALDVVIRDYTALDSRHRELEYQHEDLQFEHASLQEYYRDLNQRHEGLQASYAELDNRFRQLQSLYAALENSYNQSVSNYEELERIAVVPPYIYIASRNVEFAFRKNNQEIDTWNVAFDLLEESLVLGSRSRQNPSYLRLGLGDEVITVMDFREYVNPDPFQNVIADLYYSSPSEEAFLQEVWHIVTQLSLYSADIGETPRYPLETFLAGGGDCEDNAILFASMVRAAPVDWEVSLVYMDSRNPTEPQGSNHVIAYVNTGTRRYWVETTSETEMQPYPGGVTGWYYPIP